MVQVPRYNSQGRPSLSGPAQLDTSRGVAPANTRSVSRGYSGLRAGGQALAAGAARLRRGGQAAEAGARRAEAAAGNLANAQNRHSRELLNLVDTIDGIYTQAAERDAKNLSIDYTTQLNEIQDQFNALQGENAVTAFPGLEKRKEELRAEIRAKAKNDLSRELFDGDADLRDTRFMRSTKNHFQGQSLKADVDTSDAKANLAINEAVVNRKDVNVLMQSAAEGLAETGYKGDLLGWSDEQIKVEQEKFLGAFHTSIVDTILEEESPEDARDYLNLVDTIIPGHLKASIGKPVRKALDAKLAAAYKARLASDKREAGTIKDALRAGGNPAAGIEFKAKIAGQDGDEYRLMEQEMGDLIAAHTVIRDAVAMPDDQVAAAFQQMETAFAASETADPYHTTIMTEFRKSVNQKEQAADSGEIQQWAAIRGIIPAPAPIDLANPAPDQWASRVDNQQMLDDRGIESTLFTNEESAAIANRIRGKGGETVEESFGTVMSMVQTMGPGAVKRSLPQLAKNDPAMATVVNLASDGRSKVAMDIMEGARLAEQDGRPNVFLTSEEKAATQHDVLGNLYTGETQAGRAPLLAAADALYIERINGDPGADKEDVYEQALMEITGGLVEHNGQRNLPPVPGMTQDRFDEVVDSLTTADLVHHGNGQPVIDAGGQLEPFYPEDFDTRWNGRENKLVSLGNGGYAIMQKGGGYVRTESGEPYILELKDYYESVGIW